MNGRLRPDIYVSPVRTTSSCAHTENSSGHTGSSSGVELVVAVVLLLHVRGRVERKLVCASSSNYRSISSPTLPSTPIEGWRTEQSNHASRPCQDAHSSNVLLAEGVLHTGDDGADGASRDHGIARVVEGVPGVVCGVLFGHGGRNGGGHLVCVWGALVTRMPVVEVGSVTFLGAYTKPDWGRAVGSATASSAAMHHACLRWSRRGGRELDKLFVSHFLLRRIEL